jgi:hypothetical protein
MTRPSSGYQRGQTMSRRQGLKWRVSYDAKDSSHTRINVQDSGDFDELVLDEWLHLERMNAREWWMRLGDVYVWVTVGRDGKAKVNVRRGEYHEANGYTEWSDADGGLETVVHKPKRKAKR